MNYYDPDGNVITLEAWNELFTKRGNDVANRSWWRIGADCIGEAEISTVWIGLDHSFGHGPPLIWETLATGGPFGMERMERYSSREDALEGHARLLGEAIAYKEDGS